LSVKANQRELQQSIADFFAHAPPVGVEVLQASHTDAHADRVEARTLRASAGLNGYLLGWAGLGQVLWLERRVWQPGRGERIETACAITSLSPSQASAAELLALWRGHWSIETRLHYVRDVTMGEDACRVRSGAAPQALAAMRNAVINLVRLAGQTNVAATLRRFAARPAEALAAIGIIYPPN
jgi:hypothetical protein